MIKGGATPGGTSAYAQRHERIAFESFGKTLWQVSPAGFGCYRVSAGIPSHFEAMSRALSGGINVIDTSTNYADGGSEELVGQVLGSMITDGRITRDQIVVVSKVGYLQGRNFELSQERKAQARPFADLVPYATGLEHCIHPEFLADQLQRSLERLQLETLDVLLLHNPEYYLDWSANQGIQIAHARAAFYERIGRAFEFLEQEVSRGRIQCYGISSNTFPSAAEDAEFVSLSQVLNIARTITADHHFNVIQLPVNLYEPGGVLETNQPEGHSVLQFAWMERLGVMINRPLNAFSGNRLVRLADVPVTRRCRDDDIIQAIGALNASEKALWRKILPSMQLPDPLYLRIKDQAAIGDHLKHYWRNFGGYDRWRQFRDGILLPRLQGVFDYLEQHAGQLEEVAAWLNTHRRHLETAVRAVESLYAAGAAREVAGIKHAVAAADSDWAVKGGLSQTALRALRTTQGVTTVLVGMRQSGYVDDILQELERPARKADRTDSWHKLNSALTVKDDQPVILP
jgi:aryl-alcohol dehydrogenase-like predicted oxidoreductase